MTGGHGQHQKQFCVMAFTIDESSHLFINTDYSTVETVKSRTVSTGQKSSESTTGLKEEMHCTKTNH